MSDRPIVLAHRGASRSAAENTLEAFRIAREVGADGAELDVRRTSDGVLVVHHEADHAELGLLSAHTFDELLVVAPDVPKLEEALDVLEGLLVNIEIKCLPWEPDSDPERFVVDAVADLIAERGIVEQVIVSSFDLEAINAMRSRDPRVRTGWLVYERDLVESAELVAELGHAALHPHRAMVVEAAPETLAKLIADGLDINVWTVNDPDEIVRLAEAGVSTIITDVPDEALSVLR